MLELENVILDRVIVSDKNNLDVLFENNPDFVLYLGNLNKYVNDNTYIVRNKKNDIVGYCSFSSFFVNNDKDICCSLYYGIDSKYREQGYGKKLISDVSDFLANYIDCVFLTIDKNNVGSICVANYNDYTVIYESYNDSEMIYMKRLRIKNKKKVLERSIDYE